MSNFTEKLKAFLHDPIDKCLDIPSHKEKAKKYAEIIDISNIEEIKGPDMIASCMERSLLPKGIIQDFDEIRHPLLGEKIEIPKFDPQEISSIVEEVFEEIKEEIKNYDEKNKFIYLWRNLIDKLIEKSKDKPWKKYISLLPADTRIPDHSIWEHLKITSAVNAYWSTDYLLQNNSLFLFTIGPVQSFISQARKTQDFFMGSFFLSYLTFTGMKVIIEEYGPTSIIYPDLFNQPLMDWFLEKKEIKVYKSSSQFIDIPTIPNRFVAIIPESNKDKIKELAEKIKNKIEEEIKCIQQKTFEEFEVEKIKNEIENQFKNFPEIYWVAIPWKKGDRDITLGDLKDFFEENELDNWENLWDFADKNGEYKPNIGLLYQILYTALEKSLAGRKNLREFKNFKEKGRKCSICGERNVLFFRETKNKNKFKKYNPEAIDLTEKISPKYLADGEGLCAICFIKRTFEIYLEKNVDQKFKDFSFPSTVEIAIADFKEKAIENKSLEKFEKKIKEILGEAPPLVVSPLPKLKNEIKETIDGELFFEENLKKESIKEKFEKDLDEEKIKEIKKDLKNLREEIGNPNPYYAIIYLDGDNMGKWLSGELLPNIKDAYNSQTWEKLPPNFKNQLNKLSSKKFLTPAIHSSISAALRNYAIEFVRKIVEEEHLGKLVYAGGDDVLAFVNLRDLAQVMEKLRFSFSGEIKIENKEIKVDPQNKNGFVEKDGIYILTMGKNATLSMGVVIAHYKEPLKIVINKVFEMEKKAKSNHNKDSFSILLLKKSGEERIATYKWKYDNILTTEIIRKAKEAMNDKNERYISHNFIQKLKIEFARLKEKNGYLPGPEEIFNKELLRLISRAYNYKGKKDNKNEKDKFIENFHKLLKDFFWASGGNLDNFTNLLETASFLNKGE